VEQSHSLWASGLVGVAQGCNRRHGHTTVASFVPVPDREMNGVLQVIEGMAPSSRSIASTSSAWRTARSWGQITIRPSFSQPPRRYRILRAVVSFTSDDHRLRSSSLFDQIVETNLGTVAEGHPIPRGDRESVAAIGL